MTLHATRAPLGLDQLDILEEEGVDPRRVVVGHAHSYPTTSTTPRSRGAAPS